MHYESFISFLFFGSGILFSICISILQTKQLPWFYPILRFIFLIITYIISIACGVSTWGMAVPFIGGIGATLVCYTLNCRPSAKINGAGSSTFFIKGFISGLAGLLTYYCPRNIISQQAGFCIIVLIWQFIIGFQALKHAEIRNAENIGQDKKTPKNIDPDNIYSGKSETFRKWVIKKRF